MFRTMTHLLANAVRPTALKAVLAAGALGLVPASSFAGRWDRDDHGGWRDRDHDHDGSVRVDLDFRDRPIYRPPVYEERTERVWVEPAYRTVCDRVWVPAVTRTINDRVWVPDRYEWRDVVRYEHHRRVVCHERVLIDPGHYEERCREEVVCAGHYEDVQRQECIAPGHWETRIERLAVAPPPDRSGTRIDVRFPIRF